MKIAKSHQYYRDVFTIPLCPIEDHSFSRTNIAQGYNNHASIEEFLSNQDKDIFHLISITNFFLDRYTGENTPNEIKNYALLLIKEISKKYQDDYFQIICAKSLFRCALIEEFFEFIESRPSIKNNHNIKILIAISNIFNEDYMNSAEILADLMQIKYYKNHYLFDIMAISTFYKCGGIPEIPVDFTNIISGLGSPPPKLNWITPLKENKDRSIIVFTAADPIYFWEHALINFYSFAKVNGSGNYHFHIYNPDKEIINKINHLKKKFNSIEISATSEIITPHPTIKATYTLNRFAAIHSLSHIKKSPIFSVDADSLWRKPLPKNIESFDMAFCGSEFSPFWEKNLGGVCFFGKKESTDFFLSLMTNFSETIKKKNQGIWFQDQLALKICEETTSQKFKENILRLEPNIWCDISHTDESILWQVTTRKDRPRYNEYKTELKKIL